MATRRAERPARRVTTEYIEPREELPEAEDFGVAEDDGGGAVRAILDGIGPGDVKVKISKWGPKGPAYCFSTDGEIDEDFIQGQFGGGRYVGKIFVDGIYRKSFNLNIAERQTAAVGSGLTVSDMQMRMMQQQIDLLKDLLLRNQNQGAQSQTPVSELAQAMLALKQMEGGGLGEKAVELFMRGMEAGRGSAKDDSWTDIIKEALPVVEGFMGRKNPAAAAAPVQIAGGGENLTETSDEGRMKAVIAYLKGKATMGVDPAFFVDWVGMNCEQSDYQAVLRFVLASDFSALVALDAEIGKPPLVTFFRGLYDGLRREFGSGDSVELDTGGRSGDKGDAGGDGGAGAVWKQGRKSG